MSQRYKGGVISATPPTTSTSSASGVWTEQQFMQGVASGNWPALAGAPTIGTATAGALSASVAFTAPTYTGSGITGYTATSSPGGITGTGASSPVTVSGLTAGTSYTFTVTATTAAGQGSASAASNSVTPTPPNYIEDVYSTYLYTGNGSTQTITNGIDLSGKGGLVWTKSRGSSALGNELTDTVRGAGLRLISNTTAAQGGANSSDTTGFTSSGFELTYNNGLGNLTNQNYVSWTFRKQPKFFDVVTYTGTGVARTIAHNLGSVPGCIIIKSTNLTSDWVVYHRSLGNTDYAKLNLTDASAQVPNYWNNTSPTSTEFTVKTSQDVNGDGQEYVAYLFAHNAGGFGLTGTDNVISCGSYTGVTYPNSLEVNLGFEPQWVMIKNATTAAGWAMWDVMRGMSVIPAANTAQALLLEPNTTAADSNQPGIYPTPTGFVVKNGLTSISGTGDTIIYIAIRRGPMKTPTSGTSVFSPVLTATASETVNTVSFTPDMQLIKQTGNVVGTNAVDRLRGVSTRYQFNAGQFLLTNSTDAESSNFSTQYWNNTGFSTPYDTSGISTIYWTFRRAPGFFDEVCYLGTGSATTQAHNLGVVPELMIVKNRSGASNWMVYSQPVGNTAALYLNANFDPGTNTWWNNTTPTASVFSLGTTAATNASGATFVAYLFASVAGVSKVGSYTGTGALQTVNCGFTTGARFVLIKRTDSTGDWYVYDSARGITSGNDPYLYLNSTAAEVTGTNYVDTTGVGFQVTAAAPAGLNANGGTYIFLAIA